MEAGMGYGDAELIGYGENSQIVPEADRRIQNCWTGQF